MSKYRNDYKDRRNYKEIQTTAKYVHVMIFHIFVAGTYTSFAIK